MPTERIDIVVSERGSRTVKRNLEDLATSADRAGDETAELQRRLRNISPTAELAQTMRQMQALRQAMNQGGATSDWPRRPIQEANAQLFTAIGRMNTLKANMRDQTPWAATRQFERADNELASIQARLRAVNAQMATQRSGPTSSLAIGPQQPFGGYQMRPLTDEMDRFNSASRSATGTANGLATGVNNASSAARGAHKPFMLLNRYVGVFGGLVAAQELMQLADSATVIANRVNVVSESVGEAEQGLNALYEIARRTRTPIEEMASLYQKGMMAAEELGVSQQDVLRFVEAVGMGLAVQGSSAQTARGALIQLSQAIGTDIVRAEEFNSILEGAYPIALAAARGIDEAGGSVARLRRMVIDGEVSSEQFFNAIMSQYPQIADMFAQTEPTISQAFTVLRNELTEYIANSEEAQAISETLATAIILMADNIEPLADLLFALGIAWGVAFTVRTAGRVAAMAGSVGLLRTGLAAIAPLVGATGPVGVGLALIAGGAFLAYQNIETTAEKVERLREVMDSGITALDRYNTAVQTAQEEQAELGGVINLTTEAVLRQSRAELQTSLGALRTEIRDMERDIGGDGLNPFNLDNIRAAKGELYGMFNPGASSRPDNLVFPNGELERLYDTLTAIENGTGTIDDFVAAIQRVQGVGPEVAAASEDLATALSALPDNLTGTVTEQAQLWMDQAETQLTNIAETIGGFDAEIAAVSEAASLPEKVEALNALQQGLEAAAVAGNLVRNSSWLLDTATLLDALQDARDLEQTMMEALGANAERLNELAVEAEQFRVPIAGAETSTQGINALVNEISFTPLENGARGFADQMERAARAMAQMGNTSIQTPSGPSIVEASYSPGAVTRDNTGGLGLMELNEGGSFTVGGTGGVDQNLVAFWASRGENVLVSQPGAASESTVGGMNRLGQSREYIEVLEEINGQLDKRYASLTQSNEAYGVERDLQDAINIATENGIVLSQQDIALIRERIGAIGELEEEFDLMQEAGDVLFNNLTSAVDTFIETGKFSFKDFARSVISDLSQIGQTQFLTNPINSFLGGIVESIIPGFEMPALNEGGSFTVGGTGGVDKNVVAFKASRGERVDVTPAGKNTGGSSSTNVVFNITTPDVEGFRRSETQMAARAQRMIARGGRNS